MPPGTAARKGWPGWGKPVPAVILRGTRTKIIPPFEGTYMRQHTHPLLGLVVGSAILATACSDSTQPTPPTEPPADLRPAGGLQADDPVALARQVPGFGGF